MALALKVESLEKYTAAIKNQARLFVNLQRFGTGPGGDELVEAVGFINSAIALLDDAYESLKALNPGCDECGTDDVEVITGDSRSCLACAGIPTEALDRLKDGGVAEMMAALNDLYADWLTCGANGIRDDKQVLRSKVHLLLNKAEGR